MAHVTREKLKQCAYYRTLSHMSLKFKHYLKWYSRLYDNDKKITTHEICIHKLTIKKAINLRREHSKTLYTDMVMSYRTVLIIYVLTIKLSCVINCLFSYF